MLGYLGSIPTRRARASAQLVDKCTQPRYARALSLILANLLKRLCSSDISFTRAPKWIKLIPDDDNDKHTDFMALASLGFPHVRDAELVPPYPSDEHKVLLPPSLHFLCYDYLYYVAAVKVRPLSKYSPIDIHECAISLSNIRATTVQHGDSLRAT